MKLNFIVYFFLTAYSYSSNAEMCTMVVIQMIHTKTHECRQAMNGCQVNDLGKEGYRTAKENECTKFKKLNAYCDPVGTVYAGGNPLFDESIGKSISLKNYLRAKGLNFDCGKLPKSDVASQINDILKPQDDQTPPTIVEPPPPVADNLRVIRGGAN